MKENEKTLISLIAIFPVIILLAIIFIKNPKRIVPTFSIFPQFVYMEHFLASFSIILVAYSLFSLVVFYNINKKKILIDCKKILLKYHLISFSLFYLFVQTIGYEGIIQNFSNPKQIIFDIFGIFSSWIYIIYYMHKETWRIRKWQNK